MKNWKILAPLAVFFVSISSTSYSQGRANIQESLDRITNTADKICNVIGTAGNASSSEVKAAVNAELSGLAAKLAAAGVSASTVVKSDSYQGVLREQLATALDSNAACKLKVFDSLSRIIFGEINNDPGRLLRSTFAAKNTISMRTRSTSECTTFKLWTVCVADENSKEQCYTYTSNRLTTASDRVKRDGFLTISFDNSGDVYATIQPTANIRRNARINAYVNDTSYVLNTDGNLAFIGTISGIRLFMRDLKNQYTLTLDYEGSSGSVNEMYSFDGVVPALQKIGQSCLGKCPVWKFWC